MEYPSPWLVVMRHSLQSHQYTFLLSNKILILYFALSSGGRCWIWQFCRHKHPHCNVTSGVFKLYLSSCFPLKLKAPPKALLSPKAWLNWVSWKQTVPCTPQEQQSESRNKKGGEKKTHLNNPLSLSFSLWKIWALCHLYLVTILYAW